VTLHSRLCLFEMSADQKRSAADRGSPLTQTSTLQHVLSYVGPGHWWFVATVCGLWKDLYQQLADAQVVSYDDLVEKISITCTPHMTLYSAVFASASRVRLAEASLDCTTRLYQSGAGRYADIETLAAAHELGMPYTLETMRGCALCNTLAVMQFLRAERCEWDKFVCSSAATRGYFKMLR
jgi:hypothetical protein